MSGEPVAVAAQTAPVTRDNAELLAAVNRTLEASLSQRSKIAYEHAIVRCLQWYYLQAKDYLTPRFLSRVPPGTESLSAEFIKGFIRGPLDAADYPFIERHLTALHIIHYFQDLALADNVNANSLASHRSAFHHLRSLCHQPATDDLKRKLKKFWKGLKRGEARRTNALAPGPAGCVSGNVPCLVD
jgi:hypothetical protein